MKTTSRHFVCSLVLTLVCILGLGVQTLFAQDVKTFATKGAVELGGNIAFESETFVSPGFTDNSVTAISLAPFVGYFVDDGFEIGVNPLGISYSSYSGSSTTQVMIFVAPSYNFKTSSIAYPFIEALLGYTAQSESGSYSATSKGFSWGGRGGVKLAVAGNCLLNLGLQYLQITENPSGATSRTGYDRFSISAGFTVWFQ